MKLKNKSPNKFKKQNDISSKLNSVHNEYNDFDKIRNFLYENPNSNIQTIHKQTGIEIKIILKFINEKRFSLINF